MNIEYELIRVCNEYTLGKSKPLVEGLELIQGIAKDSDDEKMLRIFKIVEISLQKFKTGVADALGRTA